MALNHILHTITEKTGEEIKVIQKDAEQQCASIIERAQVEAEKIKTELNRDLEQKTSDTIEKAERYAAFKVKNKITDKKQILIDSVFQLSAKKLAKQQDKLCGLFERLAESIVVEPETKILCSQARASTIENALKKRGVSIQVARSLKDDGFMVISNTYEMDNRLTVLMQEIRSDIEAEIARILFAN